VAETIIGARCSSIAEQNLRVPGAGVRNNNDTIGDFCCTGETATIRTAQGTPAGFLYFYGFSGGITDGKRSAASASTLSSAASPIPQLTTRTASSICG
jgi:hypothetical protein